MMASVLVLKTNWKRGLVEGLVSLGMMNRFLSGIRTRSFAASLMASASVFTMSGSALLESRRDS
jgi:hypothetical protein